MAGRRNTFALVADFDAAGAFADRLDRLASGALFRVSAAEAVNAVATRFDVQARRGMNLGLNLSDDYIATRVRVTPATPVGSGPVRAEIVTRGDLTILGHYPHVQRRVAGTPVRSGESRGRRPSGVAVEIRKGQAEFQPQWFTMRLRVGTRTGDKVGVFVRTGDRQTKHIYGPSPYSLFRYQIEQNETELADDLQRTAAGAAENIVMRTLR